jgi:predicted ABC-type ATPase
MLSCQVQGSNGSNKELPKAQQNSELTAGTRTNNAQKASKKGQWRNQRLEVRAKRKARQRLLLHIESLLGLLAHMSFAACTGFLRKLDQY